MESKQSHLIERAAARLAKTEATAPPSRFVSAPRERDLGDATTVTPDPDNDLGHEARRSAEPRPRIDQAALATAGLVAHPNARVVEELRIVETRVLRQSFEKNRITGANGITGAVNGAASTKAANIIMVTSALKGEGKSFISLNLAGEVVRQGDRRVLLIDADGKPHGLTRALGVSSCLGLVDLATEFSLSIDEVLIPTAADGLYVIPFGRGKSGEVFASRRMGEIIETIGRRYADSLIIIDAPPCLSTSTPHALASVCGQTILVVGANSTQRGDVEAALDLLQTCPHVSLLLNKVAPWMAHSFGSYSYPGLEN